MTIYRQCKIIKHSRPEHQTAVCVTGQTYAPGRWPKEAEPCRKFAI